MKKSKVVGEVDVFKNALVYLYKNKRFVFVLTTKRLDADKKIFIGSWNVIKKKP